MINIQKNILLSKYTTLGVGGPAKYLVIVNTTEELIEALDYARNKHLEFAIIGGGSNLLVSDKGFYGLAIINRSGSWRKEGSYIVADSGANLTKVAYDALEAGWTDLAFASGIPGSVGAAVVGNVGVPDSSISDVLVSTIVWDGGLIKEIVNSELNFGYRTSILKQNRDVVVISAKFKLSNGKMDDTLKIILEDKKRRAFSYVGRTAGSYFKNPKGDKSAGELIDSLGLKSYSIRGAEISQNHANVIRNMGEATAGDIYDLEKYVIEKVKDGYNITLEPEVVKLGKF
ncbi:MAG: UDP-N-acetylmuramate dehydrogenase [bacterium]